MASMNQVDAIISIASDLTAALSSEERYRRLLRVLRRVIRSHQQNYHDRDGPDQGPAASAQAGLQLRGRVGMGECVSGAQNRRRHDIKRGTDGAILCH